MLELGTFGLDLELPLSNLPPIMTMSSRDYIFEAASALKRVSKRVADAMIFGKDALPQYAGTRQRVAYVLIENEDGKPVRIVDAQGSFWEFDNDGRIDKALMDTMSQAMSLPFERRTNANSKVVDISPKLKRREFDAQQRWVLTKDDLDRIAADIWPKSTGKRSEVTSIKGTAPKQPPLTYEAKNALSEISSKIGLIDMHIQMLSEPSLKGLAFEARKMAKMYSYEPACIWVGIADECDRRREILSRYRTGKGDWYAVVELFLKTGPHSSESISVKFEKCKGKRAAEEAARKLLAEHVDRFSADVALDVKVCCDLEWDAADEH